MAGGLHLLQSKSVSSRTPWTLAFKIQDLNAKFWSPKEFAARMIVQYPYPSILNESQDYAVNSIHNLSTAFEVLTKALFICRQRDGVHCAESTESTEHLPAEHDQR